MDYNYLEIVDRYVAAAIAHGEATKRGNSRVANQSHDEIVTALHALDAADDMARERLMPLLEHEIASVRVWAATHLLLARKEEAMKTLHEVAKLPGIIGGEARMVLQEYERGRLVIP
jgi:hypothetical protein